MIIRGTRCGNAAQLADYLLSRGSNEEVMLLAIEGYPKADLTERDMKDALKMMAAHGFALGKPENLYHAVLALQKGEILSLVQVKEVVRHLAKNLDMKDHARVVVEHIKNGWQHIHVIFDIIHPTRSTLAELKFDRYVNLRTAREIEIALRLKPAVRRGRHFKRWEIERGKQSGVNPRKMRNEVTAVFHASTSARAFETVLKRMGYRLSKGKYGSHVLIDSAGHIHSLTGRIEDTSLKDIRDKFPDLDTLPLPSVADIRKRLKNSGRETSSPPPIVKLGDTPSKPALRKDLPRTPQAYASLRALSPLPRLPMAGKDATLPPGGAGKEPLPKRPGPPLNQAEKGPFDRAAIERGQLLAWAWDNGRADVLAQFGIFITPDTTDFGR